MTIKIIEIKIKKKNYFLLKGVTEKKLIELKIKKTIKRMMIKFKIKNKNKVFDCRVELKRKIN
jgi:hypothetical protein